MGSSTRPRQLWLLPGDDVVSRLAGIWDRSFSGVCHAYWQILADDEEEETEEGKRDGNC